jgi:hypothetical protein
MQANPMLINNPDAMKALDGYKGAVLWTEFFLAILARKERLKQFYPEMWQLESVGLFSGRDPAGSSLHAYFQTSRTWMLLGGGTSLNPEIFSVMVAAQQMSAWVCLSTLPLPCTTPALSKLFIWTSFLTLL